MIWAQELKPDVYTYSILLNDAKKRDDSAAMEQILADAGEEGDLSQCAYIVADFLHAIYLSEQKREDGAPFTSMLSTYQLYFEVQPLQDLGLLQKRYQQRSTPSLMPPPPPVLGMMIVAFLAQHQGEFNFAALFIRYRDHVKRGHPIISSLAATDHTANAYLMALARNLHTLHLCPSVVEYMVETSKERSTRRLSDYVTKHAAPTVQTWSILLAAFLRHGQRLAALKVLDMMRAKGFPPNLVTWNTLISGHAALQDVGGALSALRGLKEAGFEMDESTLVGLGRIRDRRRLVQGLRASEELENIEERAASSSPDDGDEQAMLESEQSRAEEAVLTPLSSWSGG